MTLIGLDLNASRARGVIGAAGSRPHGLSLQGQDRELPASLSLEGRSLAVGLAGLALSRRLPHLVCEEFLPHLGAPRVWSAGRHRLDAAQAVAAFFEKLRSSCSASAGLVLAVPSYLSREQGMLLAPLAKKARLPLLGSVSAPIAAGLASYLSEPWSGLAVIVDVDEHALTMSALASDVCEGSGMGQNTATSPTLARTQVLSIPRLGLRAWKSRFIDAIADRCIRQSRRDPRESGASEQMLYEQLNDVLAATRLDQTVEVVVRGEQWCQNLVLRPEEVRGFATALNRLVSDSVREILADAESCGAVRLLLTKEADLLPGLNEALQDETSANVAVATLPGDAVALGAFQLAVHFQNGARTIEHHDAVVRCPLAPPASAKAKEGKKKRMFRF